jgi:hypothetical protein
MESILSIIASIVSIVGAIWSLVEAKRSAGSARDAGTIRDELVNRRKLVEVSQVAAETRRILNVVSKVGPSSDTKRLKGINSAEIAKEVEEYARALLEHSSHFSEFFDNTARALSEDLKLDIEALAEAITPDDKKLAGKSIYYKIQTFMPLVKQMADEKREHQPLSK